METNTKGYLRKKILEERKELTKQDVCELSNDIVLNLISLPDFKRSEVIMVYLSFRNEVETFKLIRSMFGMGKTVVTSYTDKEKNILIPSKLKDLDKSLEKNPYGYLEPKKEALDPVEPKDIDLIIIPGLAFDKIGNRIGYGGGYYDKLLKQTKAIKVAVAYDFQIFPRVPSNKHDIPVNYIVTPKKIIMGREDNN
ncbi:5-formyltetrahydrofolate cyclo-ligase [Clostridium sp. D2Q-14]|uniref:5-formyltetrahydrofolate cyclo-ligase n=1 Tax=Anaeromonas gelatinilytica TaxID=2683194 RepID=UPI00193BEEB5|nr:5-formyltetrahydrofolate cyclo-ligase [Anaeromonas gelatinilytica]MBS4535151.1 5-formyltetrahydrofolate cyclo-ligase [Anaeromonas gelatinilytica]